MVSAHISPVGLSLSLVCVCVCAWKRTEIALRWNDTIKHAFIHANVYFSLYYIEIGERV